MVHLWDNDAVMKEQALLDRRCHDLHTALAQGDAPLATADLVAHQLCRQIFDHFRHEEGGYLHDVMRRAPWLTDKAAALQAQHQRLRQDLAGIVEQLERPRLSQLERMAVSAAFDSFVLHFQEHEERENQLLQEAFNRDVTSED